MPNKLDVMIHKIFPQLSEETFHQLIQQIERQSYKLYTINNPVRVTLSSAKVLMNLSKIAALFINMH